MTGNLESLELFATLAETRSFRLTGERLGVSRSAVSQALRRLETRLGVLLVQRTTRSMRLTEAGERFLQAIAPALAEVSAAVRTVGDQQDQPAGLLRLAVSSIAEGFLSGPMLASFLAAHPLVRLDVVVSDAPLDIVAEGFDAGVRLEEAIEQDMVAVAASGAQRQLVVGAPDYLVRRGTPAHPRDLPRHSCIGWRPRPDTAPYRWEFTDAGRDFEVAVDPRVTTNDMTIMTRLALAGTGLTFGLQDSFRPHLDRGDLVAVLEGYCAPFPGFQLFYPRSRPAPPKLRLLVEHIRRWRRSSCSALQVDHRTP